MVRDTPFSPPIEELHKDEHTVVDLVHNTNYRCWNWPGGWLAAGEIEEIEGE